MESPAWINGGLRITAEALSVVARAAREAYARDEEACGYLQGPSGEPLLADRAIVLENLANKYHRADPDGHPRTGREYFKINALKFERAIRESAEQNTPVKVFFHSHLDCGAYFSAEDAASMTLGNQGDPIYELAYLVTAVDLGEITDHRLFIWNGVLRAFVQTEFSVERKPITAPLL